MTIVALGSLLILPWLLADRLAARFGTTAPAAAPWTGSPARAPHRPVGDADSAWLELTALPSRVTSSA